MTFQPSQQDLFAAQRVGAALLPEKQPDLTIAPFLDDPNGADKAAAIYRNRFAVLYARLRSAAEATLKSVVPQISHLRSIVDGDERRARSGRVEKILGREVEAAIAATSEELLKARAVEWFSFACVFVSAAPCSRPMSSTSTSCSRCGRKAGSCSTKPSERSPQARPSRRRSGSAASVLSDRLRPGSTGPSNRMLRPSRQPSRRSMVLSVIGDGAAYVSRAAIDGSERHRSGAGIKAGWDQF